MLNKGPSVPPIVATGVLCLVIGGVAGFYTRDAKGASGSTANAAPGMSSGPGGMSGGQGGQGGQGGRGGGQPSGSTALPRLVRNLDTVQKLQNRGLTTQQSQEIVPVLKAMLTADKLPAAECDAKLAAIEKTLTADQKQALADLQPQRGGTGGGRAGMGGGPPMSGAPGSGGGMGGGPPMSAAPSAGGMMGGGMGGQQDPERPFASERNKKALQDLIAQLENKK